MPRIKFRSGSSVVTYCPYRVGDLLLSMSSANPSDEFPGTTWSLYAQDRFPVGAGSSYPLGATGGAASVTLSADDLPRIYLQSKQRNDKGNFDGWGLKSENGMAKMESDFVLLPGGNKPHENRPPYIAVNIWRRTA